VGERKCRREGVGYDDSVQILVQCIVCTVHTVIRYIQYEVL
jgi:hypothetical protein